MNVETDNKEGKNMGFIKVHKGCSKAGKGCRWELVKEFNDSRWLLV